MLLIREAIGEELAKFPPDDIAIVERVVTQQLTPSLQSSLLAQTRSSGCSRNQSAPKL